MSYSLEVDLDRISLRPLLKARASLAEAFALAVLFFVGAFLPHPSQAQTPLSVVGAVSPRQGSYVGTFTFSASASGGDAASTRYAFFHRRPGGTWIPDINAPAWQAGNSYNWNPSLSDVGTWETYVWVKDAYTPSNMNTYGYAAGHNSQPIEVFGPPTVPGPTSASCAYSSGGECWVTGDFVISVSPSTGGLGSLIYHICRSNDTAGWGGCDVHLTMSGGTSITVSGSHLPSDGYRRAYYFQSKDSGGAYSGWNSPLFVKIDRYAPSVSASNASSLWYSNRTATISASDSHSGLQAVRYSWNSPLNGSCTSGTPTSSGTTLTAPAGDNLLYVCASDNTGQVGQWSGSYRVSPMGLTASIAPSRASYLASFSWTASASGGTPSTTRYAYFRRRPNGTWIPDVNNPTWTASTTSTWTPALADVGIWETYVWVKDGDTPASMNGGYGYAAGVNTMPIEVVGPPTVPGPTTVACSYSSGAATDDDCWVTGDFTASVTASTGGMGSLVYDICRSVDSAGGFAGCDATITLTGGTSILISGTHLPADGYRRAYYFQAKDSAGAASGWNAQRYVRVDRYAPTVSASNASDEWFYSSTATVSASDVTGGAGANSGVLAVRYSWNAALDAACTTGTATSSGAGLAAPVGDNLLYLCAKDNTGRVAQWNGRYRIANPLGLTGTVSPSRGSYLNSFTYTATATGGVPSTTRYAFFRRINSGAWIPAVTQPNWQVGNQYTWQPTLADVGTWETYIWVKDGNTPANQNGYGYAAGFNTGPIEVVGKPTVPGPTTVSCAYSTVDDCWVQGDFTATVTASTGGMGSLVYQICRSNDTAGFGGCDVNLTLSGGTSITVSGTNLPADGYRRSYYFQTQDSAGALSGWNTPRYVRVDRYAPTVSATNASDTWFSSRTATLAASDATGGAGANSGLQTVRYSWTTALDAACTTGTATSSGTTLTAPGGDNLLYLCAKDNTGRVVQWNGRYRVSPIGLTGSIVPSRGSYLGSFTWTASATGGNPATMRYAFFRRRPSGVWTPDVTNPNWQASNVYVWNPTLGEVGTWETYIWVKDGDTPANANSYGYAAGFNTGSVEVVGPPTLPGATAIACAYTAPATGDCWVAGDFTASVAPSTGGMDPLVYQICRSNDAGGGFAGCDVHLTFSGGTSIAVSGAHLPGDGFRRSYWFQAKDSAGALSGWNTPRYVRVDRNPPAVSATNASDQWFISREAIVSAAEDVAGSGLMDVRYRWNATLDAGCTTGTATASGATLTVPVGDNTLYLCARDNVSRVTQWSGRYRVTNQLVLTGTVTPNRASYLGSFTWTASAVGGDPGTTRYAFFRRKLGEDWVPDVHNPNWQAGSGYTWNPTRDDIGTWETYIWVKDGTTPPDANGYGFAAGYNTQPIEVVGPPTTPGPTTVSCPWSTATGENDCWVKGDFVASVTPSTGGLGNLVYQICRSNDSSGGFAGCEVNLTLAGGASIAVTGDHLPGDGFRRSYWFQARDTAGALSGWNTQRYVRVDRYPPSISATNASEEWFPSRAATVSAADDDEAADFNSGLVEARYSWNTALDADCTAGTVVELGTPLTAPDGDNVLYLCARDQVGWVAQWSGRYRVGQPRDFSLHVTPAVATVVPGDGAQYTISLTADPGFTGTADLNVSGLFPAGYQFFEPEAIGAGDTATLTVSTSFRALQGNYDLTVTAMAGALTHSAAAQLRVTSSEKPVLNSITPESFANGGHVRVTVQGSYLTGATVSIAEEQTDPDDPVSRVFPTAHVVSINSAGTSMEVEIDATDTRILDFYNLVVDNGADIEAIPFRVLPGGPLADAWTPSEPMVGRIHALSIAGRHLAGTTLTASLPGRIRLHSVETSETEITALLEVLPDAPLGEMKLIVSDALGRTAELKITIVLPQKSTLASRNLTASKSGEKLDYETSRRPAIWFQEFTIRDPDKTEVTAKGLRIQGIDREAYLAKRSRKSISFELYIRVTIPLVRVQWQKVILFDPLTGAIGDAVLQALGVGAQVPLGAFVISAYFQMDLTIYFRLTNAGYTFPRFCIEISYGIEITGFDGFAYHDSFCVGGGWHAFGTGSVSNGEMTGGDCASVTPASFQNGILEGVVEQNACCAQPIGVAMSGHTFSGLSWGRSFSVNNPQAGTTTPVTPTCNCTVELHSAALKPGVPDKIDAFITNGSDQPATYNWTLQKTAGATNVQLPDSQGTVEVNTKTTVKLSIPISFGPGLPAPDVPELRFTATQGTCQAAKAALVCVYPTGETTRFAGWHPQPGWDAARFFGDLTPAGTSFVGRRVSEGNANSGTASFDTCWVPSSAIANYRSMNLTGGNWNIVSGNTYDGADLIGFKVNFDGYYSSLHRVPCSVGTTQTMYIYCSTNANGSVGLKDYKRNTFVIKATSGGTQVLRDGVSSSPLH